MDILVSVNLGMPKGHMSGACNVTSSTKTNKFQEFAKCFYSNIKSAVYYTIFSVVVFLYFN